MRVIASQITSLTIVYSTVYSGADQRKHQNSASLAFVRVIHRGPVNSPHKWPVTRKMFPFDDVIMAAFQSLQQWYDTPCNHLSFPMQMSESLQPRYGILSVPFPRRLTCQTCRPDPRPEMPPPCLQAGRGNWWATRGESGCLCWWGRAGRSTSHCKNPWSTGKKDTSGTVHFWRHINCNYHNCLVSMLEDIWKARTTLWTQKRELGLDSEVILGHIPGFNSGGKYQRMVFKFYYQSLTEIRAWKFNYIHW